MTSRFSYSLKEQALFKMILRLLLRFRFVINNLEACVYINDLTVI